MSVEILTLTPGETYQIEVGAPGEGGTVSSPNGGDGGATSFGGTLCVAPGGSGGGSSGGNGGNGGAGGGSGGAGNGGNGSYGGGGGAGSSSSSGGTGGTYGGDGGTSSQTGTPGQPFTDPPGRLFPFIFPANALRSASGGVGGGSGGVGGSGGKGGSSGYGGGGGYGGNGGDGDSSGGGGGGFGGNGGNGNGSGGGGGGFFANGGDGSMGNLVHPGETPGGGGGGGGSDSNGADGGGGACFIFWQKLASSPIIFGEGTVYVPGIPVTFALTNWDPDIQGTTYELVCTGYKIGDGGLQIGLPSDSSAVNTQAVVAAALTIANTKVTEPDIQDKRVGRTTVTISAVNAPDRDLVIALFGLEEAEQVEVTDSAVTGVTPPAAGETAVEEIDNEQYTGTIVWSPDLDGKKFLPATTYTATITLKAKPGYTFEGVSANFFTVAGASSDSNAADSGVVTAKFPATGTATVWNSNIPGIGKPTAGETPNYSVKETSNFTGTVSWSPAISGGVFAENTVYTATITLSAKAGFTFDGVPENFFDTAYADTVSNAANSGVVTAVYPSTGEAET